MDIKTKENTMNVDSKINVNEMAEAGIQFGHRTSKVHPKMKPYIDGVKNSINTINLEKTKELLEGALEIIARFVSEGKTILLVGTKIQFKDLVKEVGETAKIPYIAGRWLGGTFTNFKTIKKRIDYFKELEVKKQSGELEKYTKKERAGIDKELVDLGARFGGIKNMETLPDAVFITDIKKDEAIIREARKKGVTIISIADTDGDPSQVDYFIPANDDAITSIKYILEKVKETIIKSRK
jgi:small subunit ribosomal protein S2